MWQDLLSNTLLVTLAITLLHFLWQGLVIAGILKIAFILLENSKALYRYSLATAAMLISLLAPVMTFFWLYARLDQSSISANTTVQFTPLVTLSQSAGVNLTDTWLAQSVNYFSLLSLAWIFGISLMTVKLMLELYRVNQLPKKHFQPPSDALKSRFEELAEQIGLTKAPQLVISFTAKVPMAIGWIKPVVLLPAHMLTGLSQSQLEMLLLHELAHIRRHDYLVNFLQTLVEILLFFHPAVKWVSKQMRLEREYCSDDIAVDHCQSALAYAHTLADGAQLCHRHHHATIPTMAMAASGGDLKQRVSRLVNHQCTSSNNQGKWLAGSMISLSLILGFVIQSKAPLSFGVHVNEVTLFNGKKANNHTRSSDQVARQQSTTDFVAKQTSIASQLLAKSSAPESADIIAANQQPVIVAKASQDIAHEQIMDTATLDFPVELQHEVRQISEEGSTLTAQSLQVTSDTSSQAQAVHKKLEPVTEQQPVLLTSTNQPAQLVTEQPIATQEAPVEAEPVEVANLPNTEQYASLANLELDTPSLMNNEQTQLSLEEEIAKLEITQHEAELIKLLEPKYPTIAKRRGIETDIKVNFTIGKDGRIRDIEFERNGKANYFRGSITSAMRKWRFLPAQYDGKPVESKMSKIFSFSLS